MLVGALGSKPVQSGMGLPPVQAAYSSFKDRKRPPIMGVVGQTMVKAMGCLLGSHTWRGIGGQLRSSVGDWSQHKTAG